MVELARERTVVVVTHNIQQATRGRTASRLDFPLCDNQLDKGFRRGKAASYGVLRGR